MTKPEIIEMLKNKYEAFADFIISLNEEAFLFAPENKWPAGQQLDHIIRAVSSLATGLRLPKFAIGLIFGKANRPSKSYEELVKKYISKLESGGKASGRFIPVKINFSDKQPYIDKLEKLIARLEKNINAYSENQMDTYILPHPLLGKVTIREMMYFTIYHAEHHHKLTMKNLIHLSGAS